MASQQRPTCDHPDCTDDALDAYTDAHGNDLDVCPAHYWWLVSGHKPDTLKSAPRLSSVREVEPPRVQPQGIQEQDDGFGLTEDHDTTFPSDPERPLDDETLL